MEGPQWIKLKSSPLNWEGGLDALPKECLWKDMLTGLFSDTALSNLKLLGEEPRSLMVFSGPAGNGAHMLGRAAVGRLISLILQKLQDAGVEDFSTDNVEAAVFTAGDFPARITPADAEAKLRGVSDAAREGCIHILAFYDMDRYGCLDVVCAALLPLIHEMEQKYGLEPLVALFIEEEERLPGFLLSQAMVIRTAAPTEKQRLAYLNARLTWEIRGRDSEGKAYRTLCELALKKTSAEELAKETEGFSYTQLDNLIRYLRYAGLKDMENRGTAALLKCDRDTAEACLELAKRARSAAPVVPIIQTAVQPAAQTQSKNDRLTELANKENLTADEIVELAEGTPAYLN